MWVQNLLCLFHKWVLGTRKDNSKTPYCWCAAYHSCSAPSRPGWRGAADHEALCHRFGSMARQREDEVTWPSEKGDIGWAAGAGQTVGARSPSWRGTSLIWARWPPSFRPDHSWWRSCRWCFQLIGDWQGCQSLSEGSSYCLLRSCQMTSLCDLLHLSVLCWETGGVEEVAESFIRKVLIHSWSPAF